MSGKTTPLGCRCGAVHASAAAYRQMTGAQKVTFWMRISSCDTCRYDATQFRCSEVTPEART